MAKAKDFVLSKYATNQFPEPVTEAVQQATSMSFQQIAENMQNRGKVLNEQRNIGKYILQQQRKGDIEKNIKNYKLREAERNKQQLKDKLKSIDGNIDRLQNTIGAHSSPREQKKPRLQDKETREKEKQMVSEAAERTQKLMEEQKERERRDRAKRKQREEKQAEREQRAEERRKKKEEEKKEAYLAHLEELDRKAQQRKEELAGRFDQVVSEDKRILKQKKPLYMQIQDSYNKSVVMPELEKRKAEISRLRQFHKPGYTEEIDSHRNWVDETRQTFENQRQQAFKARQRENSQNAKAQNYSSSYISAYKEEKQAASIERERLKSERNALTVKRHRYSDLVKEMYVPQVDKMKAVEINIAKEKAKLGHRPKALLRNDLTRESNVTGIKSHRDLIPSSHTRSSSDASLGFNRNSSYRPQKFKRNPLVPIPPQAKGEAKVVDYLDERRKARQSFEPEIQGMRKVNQSMDTGLKYIETADPDSIDVARKRAQKMEQMARKQELILSEMKPDNIEGIEAAEEVNSMLVNSIRAKLQLLENA